EVQTKDGKTVDLVKTDQGDRVRMPDGKLREFNRLGDGTVVPVIPPPPPAPAKSPAAGPSGLPPKGSKASDGGVVIGDGVKQYGQVDQTKAAAEKKAREDAAKRKATEPPTSDKPAPGQVEYPEFAPTENQGFTTGDPLQKS